MAYSTVQLQTLSVRILRVSTADTKQHKQADDYYTRQFNEYRCVDKPISLVANGHLTGKGETDIVPGQGAKMDVRVIQAAI